MSRILVYFHGFQSSSGTATVGRLHRAFPDWRVMAPDIPQDPLEALAMLRDLCRELQPDVILGTSLGAFYTHQMRGYRRIAVNPALHLSEMPEILHIGRYDYLQPTLTGETTFEITPEIIDHFREAEAHQWDGLREDDETIWGFFGMRDTTVDCREEFAVHYGEAQCFSFDGEHRISDRVVLDILAPAVRRLAGLTFLRCPLPGKSLKR